MKKFLTIGLALIISLTIFLPSASAQLLTNTDKGLVNMTETVRKTANFSGIPLETIMALVIQTILGFLAIVFIVLMVTAGFRWMTAQGNEEQVTEAQHTIRAAIIGLIVVLAAYAITYFVFTYLPFTGGSTFQSGTSG